MAAKRKGEKIRWRVVVVLEMLKACCRLIMTRLTKSRPLVTPPLPERETEFPVAPEDVDNTHWNGMATPPFGDTSSLDWAMPRTGLSLPTLPDSSEVTEYLLEKVLTADDIKGPEQLLHRMKTYRSHVAEVMWILRPVVYALAMQNFQGDKRSWTPWIIGVSVEIAARQLAKKDVAEKLAGGLQGLTGLEREEMRKRGWGMAWWMMRGAFYENITRTGIQAVKDKLRGKPLLEMIGGIVEDYQYLWDEYYFSTATM
jgi:peroxin-16